MDLHQPLVKKFEVGVPLQVVAVAVLGDDLKAVLATAEAAAAPLPRAGPDRVQSPQPTRPERGVDVDEVDAAVRQRPENVEIVGEDYPAGPGRVARTRVPTLRRPLTDKPLQQRHDLTWLLEEDREQREGDFRAD
jgi:hypothetical protein